MRECDKWRFIGVGGCGLNLNFLNFLAAVETPYEGELITFADSVCRALYMFLDDEFLMFRFGAGFTFFM